MSKQFIGTKILRSAELMTRGRYCEIRGWDVPADENASEEVYMVEYYAEEGNGGNLAGYEGYVSMSPKNVFEKAYSPMMLGIFTGNFANAHEVRVQEECKELFTKMNDLQNFTLTPMFSELPAEDKTLLEKQLVVMQNYNSILNLRLESFKQVSPEDAHTAGMPFGLALEALKMGKKVARQGWNGADMFAFLVDGSTFTVNRAPLNKIYPEGTEINYRPHIDLRTADGSVATWAPSGSDALAEDWMIVE